MVCTWPMGIAMEHEELYEKYKKLLVEVNRLKEENSQLKDQLGLTRSKQICCSFQSRAYRKER